MAITPRPTVKTSDADAFIDAATAPGERQPETTSRPTPTDNTTGRRPKRVRKGNKVQISVTLDEQLVDDLTTLAHHIGISRAALMTIACQHAIARGVSVAP